VSEEPRKIRTAILISGRGNNMYALIEAADRDAYPADIVLVISNREDALGVERARAIGIPAEVVPSKDFSERYEFEAAIDDILRQAGIELICLAGFMRILSPAFIGEWKDRILNIHPSLLPKFRGLHTHERALEAGAKLHGCTVHLVTAELDDGPIIAQASVPVLSSDTPEKLADRVMAEEVKLYPKALARVATNLLKGRPAI